MTTRTVVWVTCRFAAFHRWKDAPEKCAFLRSFHRHEFHVKLTKVVSHDNRDIEFIDLKDQVHEFCQGLWHGAQFEASCEQMAAVLLQKFDAKSVEVSEDGENGATVYAEGESI